MSGRRWRRLWESTDLTENKVGFLSKYWEESDPFVFKGGRERKNESSE